MTIGFCNKTSNTTNKKLSIPIDFRHGLILGETGSGKTASLITPLLEDRIKKGHGTLIFDFKGNYHYTIKALAKKNNKLQDVIEIGNSYGKSINILDNIPLTSVEKILKIILGHSQENKFWEDSAIQLGVSILAIIKYTNKLLLSSNQNYFNFNYFYNFGDLLTIARTSKDIKQFKKDVIEIVNEVFNTKGKISSKTLYYMKKVLNYYNRLNNVASDESLKEMENGTKNPLSSIIASLVAPMANLGISFLNYSSINILEELCSGKIIIFSLTHIEESALNAIVSSIFIQIHLHKMNFSDTPITIFIDEAQKVLNNVFDLPLDTLREYKVETILATQSIANLKNKLTFDKTESLLANLVHKIYLNGQDMKVPQYQAIYNDNIYELEPIIFNNYEKFKAEREYQKKYSLLKDLPFKYKNRQVIYSPFSETELLIKNKDLKQIGIIENVPDWLTRDDLFEMFPYLITPKVTPDGQLVYEKDDEDYDEDDDLYYKYF